MFRPIMQTAAFGIMALFMSVSVVAPTWACTPLIIFVSGFSEKKAKTMEPLYAEEAPKWNTRGVETMDMEWGNFFGSWWRDIVKEVKDHSGPVVLLGYSYGGDTAYLAAEEINTRIMLVTLDAVGELAYDECSDYLGWCFGYDEDGSSRDDGIEKPNRRGPWINVFTANYKSNGGSTLRGRFEMN